MTKIFAFALPLVLWTVAGCSNREIVRTTTVNGRDYTIVRVTDGTVGLNSSKHASYYVLIDGKRLDCSATATEDALTVCEKIISSSIPARVTPTPPTVPNPTLPVSKPKTGGH